MTRRPEALVRLQTMADMVLDARSLTLRQANAQRDALANQLAALNAPPIQGSMVWPSAEIAAFGYEQWASKRRAELNLKLAAQTALCHEAADAARLALGRKQALDRLGRG